MFKIIDILVNKHVEMKLESKWIQSRRVILGEEAKVLCSEKLCAREQQQRVTFNSVLLCLVEHYIMCDEETKFSSSSSREGTWSSAGIERSLHPGLSWLPETSRCTFELNPSCKWVLYKLRAHQIRQHKFVINVSIPLGKPEANAFPSMLRAHVTLRLN